MQKAMQKKKNSKMSSSPSKSAPAAKSFKTKSHQPTFKTLSDGSIRVSRTEFVGTLGDYTANIFQFDPASISTPGFDLNPGCAGLFPWLSTIANCYERFRFEAVSFRLVSANPTSMPGRVYMALDYDYDDAVPVDKLGLMNNRSAVSGPVWDELRLNADPKLLHPDDKFKYVSSNSRMNFVEPRTSYCGFLLLAVSGLPPSGESGPSAANFDIEVSYSVVLTTPVLEFASVIDTFNSTNTLLVDNVTFSAGPDGKYFTNHADLTMQGDVTRGSPIKRVRAGDKTVPPMSNRGNGSYPFEHAFDISQMPRTRGTFSSIMQAAMSIFSPADLVSVKGVSQELQCFDDDGNYLGAACFFSYNPDPGTFGSAEIGPLANSTTVGNALTSVVKFGMAAIYKKFPLARYVVPLLYANFLLAAGTMRTGLQVEL